MLVAIYINIPFLPSLCFYSFKRWPNFDIKVILCTIIILLCHLLYYTIIIKFLQVFNKILINYSSVDSSSIPNPFFVKLIFPWLSISNTFTKNLSPSFSTSSTFSILFSDILEM